MHADSESSAEGLVVNDRLTIPRGELVVRATRAGGPGGQHVNTSSTRIELLWQVTASSVLDDETRALLMEKLSTRLDADGWVRIVASDSRSQLRNRRAAEERLVELVQQALVVKKKRKPTRPGKGAREARLREKKQQSDKKQQRRGGANGFNDG